ncbi:MAG: hypothetical protein IPQ09_24315 [Myxococcales bacterium]|nr:hypothetical protein [Myxococcales bacterium]
MVHFLKLGVSGTARSLVALAAACGLAAACAPLLAAGQTGPHAPDPRLDPTERAVQLRVALTALKEEHPGLQPLEVTRAEAWLDRAEALTRSSTNPELRDLLLETAEGQLTMLRSEVRLTPPPHGGAGAEAGATRDATTGDAPTPRPSGVAPPFAGTGRATDGGEP